MVSKLKKSVLGVVFGSLLLSVWAVPVALRPALTAPASSAPKAPEKPTTTPLPEALFIPKARMQLQGDRVNLRLINKTNANITFQAVGDTEPRTLAGQATIALQGLQVPMTLTLDREDSGFILVTPKPSEQSPNLLEVTLETTTDLSADATTMRVERNGSVFLY